MKAVSRMQALRFANGAARVLHRQVILKLSVRRPDSPQAPVRTLVVASSQEVPIIDSVFEKHARRPRHCSGIMRIAKDIYSFFSGPVFRGALRGGRRTRCEKFTYCSGAFRLPPIDMEGAIVYYIDGAQLDEIASAVVSLESQVECS